MLNGIVEYKLLGLVNGRKKVYCTKCGLRFVVNNATENTNYTFWVVAYNVRKGYESPASAKVNIDTALFGKLRDNYYLQ